MNYTVYTTPPSDFQAYVEASGCYLVYEDKILFMKRHPKKAQGNTWGVAAGKLEKGETPVQAVVREIEEEVGIKLRESEVTPVTSLYVRLPDKDYIYHVFYTIFTSLPKISLDLNEATETRWMTPEEAKALPLVSGGLEALNAFLTQFKSN